MSFQVTAPDDRVTFDALPLRVRFQTIDAIQFAPGAAGNILRGSFGRIFKKMTCVPECTHARTCPNRNQCGYARWFEPSAPHAGIGPSGLADWPRPFVFRVAHLDPANLPAGADFEIGMNLFDLRPASLGTVARVFTALAQDGLGPRRARAEMRGMEDGEPLRLSLDSSPNPVRRMRVRFLTPTELKGADVPEFGVLIARIRDRASTLRALYGAGPLPIDFKALRNRADRVKMTRCELHRVATERRSGRTGQRHSLGGFIGVAEYEGELAEFVPYLEIARWTGVGRQTVWGKGEIAYEAF